MTAGTWLVIFGAFIVIAVGVLTFYLVRCLKSLSRSLEITQEILEEIKPQIEEILSDVSNSTSSARKVVVKVNDIVGNFISLPEFAKTFAKQTLSALLGKGKR